MVLRDIALCAVLVSFCLTGCDPQQNRELPALQSPATSRFASSHSIADLPPYLWTDRSYVEGLLPLPRTNDPFSETGCIIHPPRCTTFADHTTRAAAIRGAYAYLAMVDGVAAFKLHPGRGTSPLDFTFRSNVSSPDALAFDRAGNLFVASLGVNNVDIFLRATFSIDTPLSHYIHEGINHPIALVFDRNDNLFVANYVSSSLTEYLPTNRTHLHAAIYHGINKPTTLATDGRGYIYVGNSGSSTVAVYAPATTTPAYTIETGVNGPSALTVDSNDDLYVANYMEDSVKIYAPNSTTPKSTLNVYHPEALAVDESFNLYVISASSLSVFVGTGHHYIGHFNRLCCGNYKGVLLGPRL